MDKVYRIGTMFVGAGGAHLGALNARAEAMGVRARFESAFAVDCWPTALETCNRMTGCRVDAGDLFTAKDYAIYHGHRPPPGWQSMSVADLRRISPEAPDIISASPPCKGFTRILPSKRANLPKYEALNRLVLRWLVLCLEAWPTKPPRLILMENVPDIADPTRKRQRRGEALIARVEAALYQYGYACRRTQHDCGELGGLAQTRKRFLLVARHMQRCPALLYEPWKLPLRSIGSAIGDLPMPCFENDVPHHVLPAIHQKTEHRLAFVGAGQDWRSIEGHWKAEPGWREIERGGLRFIVPTTAEGDIDPTVASRYRSGVYGVADIDEPADTITGNGRPGAGPFSVADPVSGKVRHNKYAVRGWGQPALTVTGSARVGSSACEVADPRMGCEPNGATLRVVSTDRHAPTVTGTGGVWTTSSIQIADPAPNQPPRAGAFGVQSMDGSSCTITGSFDVHNSAAAVAAPPPAPAALVKKPLISWVTGCWNRPMTIRELANLQTVPMRDAAGDPLVIAGSASDQCMQIGNMIPPYTFENIASQMLMTFLCNDLGISIVSGGGLWVREWVRERGREGWVAMWKATSRRGDGRSGVVLSDLTA